MTGGLVDGWGRPVGYLRVSVTDRCDLRCVYCMSESMSFLERHELLSLEELERLCLAFIRTGVRRIRLTGGEPLLRRGVMQLVEALGRQVAAGALDELTLTTNGTLLARHAAGLAAAGVRRLNVSLDTLDPGRFRAITRRGDLDRVLDGLAVARQAGLAVKINAVALKGINDDEHVRLVEWCGAQGFDLTFIETMPLGEGMVGRLDAYLPLAAVRQALSQRFTLVDSTHRSSGPSRYVDVVETGRRVGFIAPLSHNFCESCNRVRISCTGTLFTCLGHDHAVDLRAPLRIEAGDGPLERAIAGAIAGKPKGHDFAIERAGPAVARHMSVTGG